MSVTIELWNDTGYTESGVERPPIGATLPAPDLVYRDLNPQRNELFSSVQIKAPYTDLYKTSYLRATYDFNESEPLVIYGWVDSVALVSDTDRFPNTQVIWHVDLWRTYARNAVFRAGTVRRRPATSDIPPQPYPYRFVKTTDPIHAFCGETLEGVDLWWCFVNYVKDSDLTAHDTYLATACFPVIRSTGGGVIAVRYVRTPTKVEVAPTMADITSGLLEEKMMIDPQSIISVTLSPLAPCSYTGTGTQSDPFELDEDRDWLGVLNQDGTRAWFRNFGGTRTGMYEVYSSTLPRTVRTDDTTEYVIQDLFGTTVGRLPWGLSVKNYSIRVVNAITSFYIQIRFDGIRSQPEGLEFNVPLPMVSVTGNSWSSYVYSGQRDYDIRMRQLQTAQGFADSLTGGLTTGINTYQMEKLSTVAARDSLGRTGSKYPAVKGATTEIAQGMLRNAAGAGMVAGMGVLAAGATQTVIGLAFNNEYQHWEDYAHARQTDNIVLSGDGFDFLFNGTHICLSSLVKDPYSVQQRDTDISMYGAHVTEPLSSCQALVVAGGPLQITNMTVGGDIPVEAKEYIRMMFSNGVRLV